MKLRTSSFKTALLKDLTRFAPVWGLYLVGMLLLMLTYVSDSSYPRAAESLGQSLGLMGVVNILYAGLCAQLLFGDLFNSRLCNALHAMPLRREAWFLSHVIAGMSFSLVPNTVCVLALLPRMGELGFISLFWLAGMTMEFLFFFGLAVLSMLCSGNRFAMAAVYGILNFASMLVLWFVYTIYEPMLYGIMVPTEPFKLFSPVVYLLEDLEFLKFSIPGIQVFTGLGEDWRYLWILAAVGAVMLALALLLYRRRKLECAGDFLAVRWLNPVFSVIYTLTVAAVFAMAGDLFADGYTTFFIVGFFVGFLTGQMLLHRTIRIFTARTVLKLAVFGAVLALSIGVTAMDPFGVVNYVPQAAQVKSVELYDGKANSDRVSWLELTDPGDIGRVLEIHQDRLENKNVHYSQKTGLTLRYTLKDGRQIKRYYQIAPSKLREFFSRPEYVLGVDNIDEFVKKWDTIQVDSKELSRPEGMALLHAVFADCAAGTMAQGWDFHDQYGSVKVWISLWNEEGHYLDLRVYEDNSNTMKWLKENYELWGPEGMSIEDFLGI